MPSAPDPLVTLRRHAAAAPWSGRELVALADRLLTAAGRPPERPMSLRTLHFYVASEVIQPPHGRGAGAGWGYPHLVELLASRVRQAAGERLESIAERRRNATLGELEVAVATALAVALPAPAPPDPPVPAAPDDIEEWREFAPARGVVLRLASGHPLLDDPRRLAALLDGLAREAAPPTRES